LTIADKKYLDMAKQLFSGAIFNAFWDGDLMLIPGDDVQDEDLKWFVERGIYTQKRKNVFDRKDILQTARKCVVCFQRFHMFSMEFKRWQYVIYLDCDIIVNNVLDGMLCVKGVGSVKNSENKPIEGDLKNTKSEDFSRIMNDIGVDVSKGRYADGTFVVNTDMIHEDIVCDMKSFSKKVLKFCKGDKAFFNLFFYDMIESIPYSFNCSYMDFKKKEDILNSDMSLIHFWNTKNKIKSPWNKNSEFYDIWKENLDKADDIFIQK
jgi:lipopolysaccharide biosynthesis glycosyltransferase